jgi:hypothetical protein
VSKIVKKLDPIQDLPLMKSVVARLCTRQLAGTQSISNEAVLFSYLFNEFNTYLFGIEP